MTQQTTGRFLRLPFGADTVTCEIQREDTEERALLKAAGFRWTGTVWAGRMAPNKVAPFVRDAVDRGYVIQADPLTIGAPMKLLRTVCRMSADEIVTLPWVRVRREGEIEEFKAEFLAQKAGTN